ncbi:MAG: hypothetical protein JNL83_11255 [Myxococcales bacterium]|nr:hypothetical protein [Myxococcales bacterium]
MRATPLLVLALVACSDKESGSPPAPGSSAAAGSATAPATTGSAAAAPATTESVRPEDDSATVAALVVSAVGSKAFGGQTIDASCVAVRIVPSGDSTVAAARLVGCGDNIARSMIWIYTRAGAARTWTESFLGTPPKCWKGIPPEIKQAVAVVTRIQNC